MSPYDHKPLLSPSSLQVIFYDVEPPHLDSYMPCKAMAYRQVDLCKSLGLGESLEEGRCKGELGLLKLHGVGNFF